MSARSLRFGASWWWSNRELIHHGAEIGLQRDLWVAGPAREQMADSTPNAPLAQFKLRDVATLFKTPTFLLLAGMLPLVTSLVLFAFFVTYFVDVGGWETADAAILFTTFMAGFTISSFLGGFLGDRFDKRFGPNGRVALMQLYLAAFAVMSYLALQVDWGRGVVLYVILFLFGLIGSIGFSGVVLPMVSAIVPPELSATAFALLFSLIQGLIAALMSLALGFLAQTYGLQNVMFWMITVPYLLNYLGLAWYVRKTYVPASWQGQRVFLRVGSANYLGTVYVNGERVGSHEGGHLPFACEVSSLLRWDAENTIAISVENELKPTRVPSGNLASSAMSMFASTPRTTFDFFPFAGLHRPVVLYSVPQTAIDDITVVTNIDGSDGSVKVTVRLSEPATTRGSLTLSSTSWIGQPAAIAIPPTGLAGGWAPFPLPCFCFIASLPAVRQLPRRDRAHYTPAAETR